MDAAAEEDVNALAFGPDFGDGAYFMSNAETAVLLSTIQKSKGIQRPPEAFTKSLSYAQAHMGAVQLTDVEEIDELFTALRSLEFERPVLDADDGGEGGGVEKIRLHQYQIVALANLNPSSTSAARSLIPSLERFTDEELSEMLGLLRRASAKWGPSGTS